LFDYGATLSLVPFVYVKKLKSLVRELEVELVVSKLTKGVIVTHVY